jgi:hypothetical protein
MTVSGSFFDFIIFGESSIEIHSEWNPVTRFYDRDKEGFTPFQTVGILFALFGWVYLIQFVLNELGDL